MSVRSALYGRNSTRSFSSKEVSNDTITALLENALQSPSGGNMQPYKIAVATGDLKAAISQDLQTSNARAQKLLRGSIAEKAKVLWQGNVIPNSDYNLLVRYPKHLLKRKQDTGFGLYGHLGIERNDYAQREKQMAHNYDFFGAPAALFVFVNKKLGAYGTLDAGIFLQSLMLSAHEEGLGTCAQASVAAWSTPVRSRFAIPSGYKLLCGMSLGYPDDGHVNEFRPARANVQGLILSPKTK